MTKDETLRLALEALEVPWNSPYVDGCDLALGKKVKAITAIKAALEAKDEPVAWGVFEGNLHDMFFSQEEAQEMADLKGTHAEVRPLYATPPQPEHEPVAWVCYGTPGKRDIDFEESDINALPIGTNLYTTPPQRTWVGLMRGVRVDGDTVVITVKGGNDAARELCGALIEEMNK